MLRPQPHETIADPACGSGGFLVASLRFLQKNMLQQPNTPIIPQLFGFDINKSVARLAKVKLILENNASSNIRGTNSLGNFGHLILPLQTEQTFEGFDIILTNPPFGTIGN